jgi:hypothetical protein
LAADADAAEAGGQFAVIELAQVDAASEGAGEVGHQGAEIDAGGGRVEDAGDPAVLRVGLDRLDGHDL